MIPVAFNYSARENLGSMRHCVELLMARALSAMAASSKDADRRFFLV